MGGCLAVTGADAALTYVDEQWLFDQGVQFWTEVPLWIPSGVGPLAFRTPADAAERAGLTWRPLRETLTDTWAWQQQVDGGWHPTASTPGLAADRERDLLAAWHART